MIDLMPAAHATSAVAVAIGDEQLDRPTPCTEFRVRDLVEHLYVVAVGFAALARGEPDAHPEVTLRPGRRADVPGELLRLAEAWREPSAWGGSRTSGGLELPAATWGRIALTELVVHGWDLARATGLPYEPPQEALLATLEHVRAFVPTAPVPALWGTPKPTAADAPLIDQGRRGHRPRPPALGCGDAEFAPRGPQPHGRRSAG